MQPSTPPPHPSRQPAPPPRRPPPRALLGTLALALGALALACALSSLRAPRAAVGTGAKGTRLAWSDGVRLRGPFGSSVGLRGRLAGAPGAWPLALRLRLTLDLRPSDEGEP